jgi:replicative DNA helicase
MRYLTGLAERTPVLLRSAVVDHGRRVRDLAVRRQARDLGRLVTSRADNDSADTAAILGDTRAKLDELVDLLTAGDVTGRVDAIAARVLAELTDDTPGRGVLRTGFEALDRLTSGLPRDLAVLAALPSEGKTALATGLAVNVARTGAGVLIASLETPREVLLKRMVAAEERLDVQRAIAGTMTKSELTRFVGGLQAIAGLPIFIEHDPMAPRDIWAKARSVQLALHSEGRRLGAVVVDYLQLLRAPARRVNRHEEVADIARALKNMAVELRVPVLALSQLNASKVEGHPDGRPRVGDLAESGEIRKCARLILGLYRPDAHAKRRDYQPTGIAEVEILKNNNGASGGIARLRFDGPSTRFSDLEGAAPGHSAECRCSACAPSSIEDDDHPLTPPEFQT